jgi:hypothetical protein
MKTLFVSFLFLNLVLIETQSSPANHFPGKSVRSSEYITSKDSLPAIDTASLFQFWNSFKDDLKNNNKLKVTSKLVFPAHAVHLVTFKYSHDCDTTAYVLNQKKYSKFDITSQNVDKYYDFIFSDVLREIISQTSAEELLQKGYRNEVLPGITYIFFAKDYNVKVACPNDHNLKFYIICKKNKWSIEIGGL